MSVLIDMKRTKAMLERHEGRETYPYVDSTGHISIGVGWNLTIRGLPEGMIDELFSRAYAQAVSGALHYPWFKHLNGARKAVIVSMLYNLGKEDFDSFKNMKAALASCDYETAAREMMDSLWAEQVGLRARELADMMLTGEWQDE